MVKVRKIVSMHCGHLFAQQMKAMTMDDAHFSPAGFRPGWLLNPESRPPIFPLLVFLSAREMHLSP